MCSTIRMKTSSFTIKQKGYTTSHPNCTREGARFGIWNNGTVSGTWKHPNTNTEDQACQHWSGWSGFDLTMFSGSVSPCINTCRLHRVCQTIFLASIKRSQMTLSPLISYERVYLLFPKMLIYKYICIYSCTCSGEGFHIVVHNVWYRLAYDTSQYS